MPPPALSHSLVVARLNRILGRYVDAHVGQCELLVPRAAVWTRRTYLEPDLFLVTRARLAAERPGRITRRQVTTCAGETPVVCAAFRALRIVPAELFART